MSYTHTYAKLAVSQSIYDEVKRLLLAVDYGHTLHVDVCTGRTVIDMHGIALDVEPTTSSTAVSPSER